MDGPSQPGGRVASPDLEGEQVAILQRHAASGEPRNERSLIVSEACVCAPAQYVTHGTKTASERRRTHPLSTWVNKPSADVPELAGWHHVPWCRPFGEYVGRRFVKEEVLCRPKRTPKRSFANSSRRRGARATWPPWTNSWLPTTSSTLARPPCRLAPRA